MKLELSIWGSDKRCRYLRIKKKMKKKDSGGHLIFMWKPNSGENHGQQQWHRIHYNMSEQKTISKQTIKEEINKRDKDLRTNGKGGDE